MTDKFKISLTGMWLLVSAVCLVLPIFLPSAAFSPNPAANAIGTATATMFILSFPSSLFGIPLLIIVDYALGVDPNSIQGMYVNLFLLFVLGLVQWFWIVPRVWRREPGIQVLQIPSLKESVALPPVCAETQFSGLDDRERTPLERVLSESDE
jgi:hypothetical protein